MTFVPLTKKAIHRWRTDGWHSVAQRSVSALYRRMDASALDFPLLPSDIADSRTLLPPKPSPPPAGAHLRIGWVTTPPSLGSGGHTTLFRMVQAAEAAGHVCTIFLYDRYGGALQPQIDVIREGWPELRADVLHLPDSGDCADALVASAWSTAHAVAVRPRLTGKRLYFIQDYEPFFYPRGFEYSLAEDSYRLGFRHIALGPMVADRLARELGVGADVVEFSCDSLTYHLLGQNRRCGVVFYARPDTPRRGHQLAVLGLQEFHRTHPNYPIHVYGQTPANLPFPVTQHGRLTPTALNALYNQVSAGLAMSFTNITLVAEEMLAAGVIPIANDLPDSRAVLDNGYVSWARPTPSGVAEALRSVVMAPDTSTRASAVAASVRNDNWQNAALRTIEIVEDEVHQAARTPGSDSVRTARRKSTSA